MLIDYEYCSGCRTCEIACKQEYQRAAGKLGGVEVQEYIHTLPSGNYILPISLILPKPACFVPAG